MRRRKAAVFAALACAALLTGGCSRSKAAKRAKDDDRPVIVVGSDNYPPFNYEDASGLPTGIDVDLATEAFGRLGYRAAFLVIDWENKKELVECGAIDCIWGSFSIDGREAQYRWTEPYMLSRQVVAVRRDSDIYALSDLAGKRVAGGAFPLARRPEASGAARGVFAAKPGIDLSVFEQGLRRRHCRA